MESKNAKFGLKLDFEVLSFRIETTYLKSKTHVRYE